MTDVMEIIRNLPDVQEARDWARAIVAARGDAHSDWLHENGLRIEGADVLCDPETLIARENASDGRFNIITRLEVVTYPNTEFDAPIVDEPNRTWVDVPIGLGGARYKCFTLPLTGPTLVRKVETGYNAKVCYTLYEMEPGYQRRVAETNASRIARGIVTGRDEMRAWLEGTL